MTKPVFSAGLPATLTEAISRLKEATEKHDWADAVYERAYDFDRSAPGSSRPDLVPRIYTGTEEYIDCRPDDTRKSVVFFRAASPETSDFDRSKHNPRHRIRSQREISLYGWVNVSLLDTPDLEKVKTDIYKDLKELPFVTLIRQFVDGRFSEVFDPYTFGDGDGDWKRYDRYPFLCFRQDFTVMLLEKP